MLSPGRIGVYDKRPVTPTGFPGVVVVGWEAIAARLAHTGARVVVIDCYPGVLGAHIDEIVRRIQFDAVIDAETALLDPTRMHSVVEPDLTDDPVFGHLTDLELVDLFDAARLSDLRRQLSECRGRVVVRGVGAALVTEGDLVVHADLARWEIQRRQRQGLIGNLGADNAHERASLLYKRGYFVDWRVADRHKKRLWPGVDFVLDTNDETRPKLVPAAELFAAVRAVSTRPFRVVPYFDPAPWGGQWMKEVCDLDRDVDNFGWCFDCVPEENSLLLGFGPETVELPALDLVLREPRALLGLKVVDRYGPEFPIRFDFLDTMGGGNLSLQVHPLTDYITEQFGVGYTQDESYYLLDAEPTATVYLGLVEDVDSQAMRRDLEAAEEGSAAFDAERYVNRFPAAKHDHFSIPAGTVHCSGAGSMVLEISATPYIFTFKLWDWGRPGLDGRPRPVHIDHGLRNIRWDRTTRWVEQHLLGQTRALDDGPGWRRERTGLHEAEPIETHRHWFSATAPHTFADGVQVLNLVEGPDAVVESPDGAFEPYLVHYAETFILPAAAGPFTVRPGPSVEPGDEVATIEAFIR